MKPGAGNQSGYDSNKPRYVILNCSWTEIMAAGNQHHAIVESFLKMKILKAVCWFYSPAGSAAPVELKVSKDVNHANNIFTASLGPPGIGFHRLVDKIPTVANQNYVEDDALYITLDNTTIMELEDIAVSILAQLMD